MKNGDKLNRLAVHLLKWWSTPVFRYGVENGRAYAKLFPGLDEEEGIDERIRKIDEARENLVFALSAIDELKNEADLNKKEAHDLKARIQELSLEKSAVDVELQEIKKITGSNIDAFKRVAGIPSRQQIAKERLVGFILGILASLLATLLWEKWSVVISWFLA